MIEKKYVDFMEKVINIWRDYEHEKIKEISGAEIDKLLAETEEYLKRLKELRVQIDKKAQEKTIESIYADTINLLKSILGNKAPSLLVQDFEKQLVKKGKMTPQHMRILRSIISAKADFKKKKLTAHKVDDVRKEASTLINDLIEFSQRCDLVSLEKGKMRLKFKDNTGELLISDGKAFLFKDNKVFNITLGKVEDSNMGEVSESVESQKTKDLVEFNSRIFDVIKKEFGDFEIVL
jgi:polyhydroxyalkanoate synthesis regulator phasin